MKKISGHTFHIPVMGLSYTIDTPVKIARFGISSVVSIIQDELIEQMREHHCKQAGEEYRPIPKEDPDHRARRVMAYLNLLQRIINRQVEQMKKEPFEEGKDIITYFKMLPEESVVKRLYRQMQKATGAEKEIFQNELRNKIVPGTVDVNIMTKVDNPGYTKDRIRLPSEYSDALSAFRGFAKSDLSSSVVFSAGLNPRLYSYVEQFSDFFPDERGSIRKKIILKVSDYRSALIQGKFLAKKGLWVSEFRIESGLNCGGHAFPTDGYLLGPILEEFKNRKEELTTELAVLCNDVLQKKGIPSLSPAPEIRITAQGGIGTAAEDRFLREHYHLDSTGWGSPFLLVPEATNVDEKTLQQLASARPEDYYLSHASPLGLPFNNFRKSTSEEQRKARIDKLRPGSPCYKKHLAFNTEFTDDPICTASREYQNLKLKELAAQDFDEETFQKKFNDITEKDCLCEGLSASALLKNHLPVPHHLEAVTICPGPNLAFFSRVVSLEEMIGHIYGRTNVRNALPRSHMFVNELRMYVDFFREELQKTVDNFTGKQAKYLATFKENLLKGITYYQQLIPRIETETEVFRNVMKEEITLLRNALLSLHPAPVSS